MMKNPNSLDKMQHYGNTARSALADAGVFIL